MSESVQTVTVDATPWLVLLTIFLLGGKMIGWWATMPWLWVFAPLWGPIALIGGLLALMVGAMLITVIGFGIAYVIESIRNR